MAACAVARFESIAMTAAAGSSATGLVRVEGVAKRFKQRNGPDTVALDGCSFTVEPGKLTVLMGPSGCGKSTLAYLLAGYLKLEVGRISIDGVPIRGAGPDRLLVFQETALWPWMSVVENVMFGPLARGAMTREQARHEAQVLLARFGLDEFGEKYPNQLSGGMKRRAELAQALINQPKVMILDEPFRGLDVMTRELMQEYYMRLFESTRPTTLFITSELEEAIFLADQLLFMSPSPGRIIRTMEVDLPHPRTFATMETERYLEVKKSVIETLNESGAFEENQVNLSHREATDEQEA
jgi:NitT/TauT family transport system ATP-binding protein